MEGRPAAQAHSTDIAVLSDLHPQHHSAVLVLEVVAVEHPCLSSGERVAKIDGDADRLAGPDRPVGEREVAHS